MKTKYEAACRITGKPQFFCPELKEHMHTSPIHITAESRQLLADTLTPVGLYLRLRDRYAAPLLLESSDYHSRENSYSFICLEPLARFVVRDGYIIEHLPDQEPQRRAVSPDHEVPTAFRAFQQRFSVEGSPEARRFNGFFGHTNYDAVPYFDTLQFDPEKPEDGVPQMQ